VERGKVVKAVLDTTILIDMLDNKQEAIEKIEDLRKELITLYTTAVNIYEVWKGVKRVERNQEKYVRGLKLLTANIYVLPFNVANAENAAKVYAELAKRGKFVDEADYMIAGCCLSNDVKMIITRNEKHFKEIKQLKVVTY
jgi:predicted nucleic acid-binding protein